MCSALGAFMRLPASYAVARESQPRTGSETDPSSFQTTFGAAGETALRTPGKRIVVVSRLTLGPRDLDAARRCSDPAPYVRARSRAETRGLSTNLSASSSGARARPES